MAFLNNISSKNKLFIKIFAYSELAWRANLKNGLIFFIAMNFGNYKQTADASEMSVLRFFVNFVAFCV